MLSRIARAEDRDAMLSIWRTCFDDPPSFVDWFFSARFVPEYSAVTEEEGSVVSCLHTLPLHIRLRDTLLPCAILAGVATLPDYAGRACMRRTMTCMMQALRARDIPLVPHRPRVLGTFFKLGHFPVSDTQYVRLAADAPRPAAAFACEALDIRRSYAALYRCYAAFSRRYSGMIQRSYADFVLKCEDYLSYGAQCLAVRDAAGELAGYCIYFMDTELLGEECAACGDAVYTALYEGLAARAASVAPALALTLRLPADVRLACAGITAEIQPRSVMGVADVRPVLRAMGLTGGAVEITDAVVPQNAGVYDLRGEPTTAAPQLRLPAGRLLQWAVGYRSMAELAAEHAEEVTVLSPAILPRMDSIGKRACFIIDEY